MDYFPLFADLRGRLCLVIGGGETALRKVRLLHRAQARVRVISPELDAELQQWVARGDIEHRAEAFSPKHLQGARLVVAASEDMALDARVARAADTLGILANAVDQPPECTFITPAIVDRDPLLVAMTTGGAAPVLARRLRTFLETLLPENYGTLLRQAAGFRDRIAARLKTQQLRRLFWERVFDLGQGWRSYDASGLQQALERTLDQVAEGVEDDGEVYLVGAGPGDPDLLTLRALQLLQRADIILHDRLVSPAIIERARRDAERIDVGKRCNDHAMTQSEINALMIEKAAQGFKVCRLKGGDPNLFGRVGEELAALRAAGVRTQVVPGITAASAAATAAGVSLTHRANTPGVMFLTGHRRNGEPLSYDWALLARVPCTLVFYMAFNTLEEICAALQRHGMCPDMPAAMISAASTPEERSVVATLAGLAEQVRAQQLPVPALLMVGQVLAETGVASAHVLADLAPEVTEVALS